MNKIKQARLKTGLSRAEIARLLKMPYRTLENWENDVRYPADYIERLVLKEIEQCSKTQTKEERKIKMKYYNIGIRETTGSCPQEYTAYTGFDFDEAKKAYEKEKYNFEHNYTDSEKAKNEVFAECYTIPDDIDITDEDEVTNAVCDCIGCNPIEF